MSVQREDSHPRRRLPLGWRVLRAAVVAIVSLYALYVIALNVFMSTSLFDKTINQDPITLEIHFRRGWTLVPGRIHASDLSIRSSDSNVEWILRLDEVEFDLSFVSLARQRFEVTRARGHGISMRARQKLMAWPDSAEEVALLPPIPGFPAFSVRPSGPPSLERWFDEHYHLWTVVLEDIVAENVREVWIDQGRFEGDARIAGRFFLKPIRAVEVGPAELEMRPGSRVTFGPSLVIAKAIAGTADVTLDRFDPRTVDEREGVLRHVTMATELKASLADVDTLPFAMPGDLYVSSEIEARRLALKVNRGVVKAGTRVELGSNHAKIAKDNGIGHAGFEFIGEVVTDGGGDQLRAGLELKDLSLIRADQTTVLRAPRVAVDADARALDLAHEPLQDAHVVMNLPDAELPDASVLNVYVPKDTPLAIVSGAGRTNVRLELFRADKRLAGSANLQADALDVRLAKLRTRGSYGITASFGAYHWEANTLDDAKLAAIVSHGSFFSERDAKQPKIEARSMNVAVSAPHVDLADPLRALDATFAMPEASIIDVTLLSPYLPKSNMKVLRGHSRFEFDGHVAVEDHIARGELHARSKSLGLEFGDVHVDAAVDARARVHDWKWERGDLAVDDAAVDITGLSLSRGHGRAKLASIKHIAMSARSASFTFADPLARIDLTAKIAGGDVADPAAIDAFLPDDATYGFASDHGSFEADARLSIKKHVARGSATVRASRMGVTTTPFSVQGDTEVAIAVERWDIPGETITIGPSRLAFSAVRGRFGDKAVSDLTADRIELTGKANELDISSPSLRSVDARLVIEGAELPDARALQAFLPEGGSMRIESGAARAYGAVEISSSTHTGSGGITVDILHGGVGLGRTQLVGDFSIRAKLAGFDPETSTLDLSGTNVAMREVEVTRASAETARWKGDVVLQKGTLRLDGLTAPGDLEPAGPQLDGILRLAADDARPLLGVLLRDSIPGFLANLAKMPRLTGYARVHVEPRAVLISDVSASGGDVAVRGCYGIHGDDSRGAFIVEKGPFSVGLDLGKEGASPHFFNLDAWLGAQVLSVKAKHAAKAKPALAPAPKAPTPKVPAPKTEREDLGRARPPKGKAP